MDKIIEPLGYSIDTLILYMNNWPPYHERTLEMAKLDVHILLWFQFQNPAKGWFKNRG